VRTKIKEAQERKSDGNKEERKNKIIEEGMKPSKE